MPPKIGIFDPGFDFVGHYVAFNRYFAELIGNDFQLVFLDVAGRMRSAYENKIDLKYAPTFIDVTEAPTYSGRLSLRSFFRISWWRDRLGDLFWYGKAFKNISKLDLDLVIINSQRGPFIYLQKPRFPFCLVVGPSALMEARAELKGLNLVFAPLYDFFIRKYFSFLGRAKIVFTTNEPSIPLAFHPTVWLPLGLKAFKQEKTVSKRKFLTIGTISDSKNHLFAINAFEKFNLPFSYLIAGPVMDGTGEEVKRRVTNSTNPNITGILSKISQANTISLIQESDFLIFPMTSKGEREIPKSYMTLSEISLPLLLPIASRSKCMWNDTE